MLSNAISHRRRVKFLVLRLVNSLYKENKKKNFICMRNTVRLPDTYTSLDVYALYVCLIYMPYTVCAAYVYA